MKNPAEGSIARPTVTFPAAECHHRLTGTKLHCQDAKMRTNTWSQTELPQKLKETITGSHSHAGSQVLRQVRHHLVDVFSFKCTYLLTVLFEAVLPVWSAKQLSTHQSPEASSASGGHFQYLH